MAITERDGRWHITFEGPDGEPQSKSFSTHGRAQAWVSRNAAAKVRYAQHQNPPNPFTDTLGELTLRYGQEVSSQKRGAKTEGYRISMLSRVPLASLTVAEVTPEAIATYRNERLAVVANSTVRNELSIIRSTIETARREWGYELPFNVATLVSLPPLGLSRDRRLEDGEYEKLARELADYPIVWAFVRFAIETAMRRGEILALKWRNVHLAQGTVQVSTAKNGSPRTVPLTDGAVEVLQGLKVEGETVFNLDISALRWAWTQACDRAGLKDLRIHDLRHEGCSRLFELGLTVPEVASISGHKTAAMLLRYTHPNARDIRSKLKGRKHPRADG